MENGERRISWQSHSCGLFSLARIEPKGFSPRVFISLFFFALYIRGSNQAQANTFFSLPLSLTRLGAKMFSNKLPSSKLQLICAALPRQQHSRRCSVTWAWLNKTGEIQKMANLTAARRHALQTASAAGFCRWLLSRLKLLSVVQDAAQTVVWTSLRLRGSHFPTFPLSVAAGSVGVTLFTAVPVMTSAVGRLQGEFHHALLAAFGPLVGCHPNSDF